MRGRIKLTKLSIIILVFILSLFFINSSNTFSIYRTDLEANVNLSVLDSITTYTVSFNSHGGGDFPSITKLNNEAVGTLPTPSKQDYNFVGWYTEENGGTKYEANTLVSSTVTLHAHYVKIVCKEASVLHTESCSQSSSGAGCRGAGYAQNATITYGTIPGNNSPLPGDAYDCDVNNDGVYDASTERFYYIRENNSDDRVVLIHYTSIDEYGAVSQARAGESYLFDDALDYLPTSSTWTNPALATFDGKVSRLPVTLDVETACGILSYGTTGYMDSCQYFMENSRFQSDSLGRAGIWIDRHNNGYYRIHTSNRTFVSVDNSSYNTTRPVIEIPVNTLDGYVDKPIYTVSFNSHGGTNVLSFTRYEGQAVGSLPEPVKEEYIFDGWYTDTNYTTVVTAQTVIQSDVVFHAKWTPEDLMYVFLIRGSCTFNGTPTQNNNNYITSTNNDCISTINPTNLSINYTDTGYNYIDTGIPLFSIDNYEKDFEVGFTVDSYVYNAQNQQNQATFINSKLENSSLNYPGFVVRRSSNKIDLTEKFNGVSENHPFTYTQGMKIRIVRKNKKIYYAKDNDSLTLLQDITNFSQVFNLNAWFGAISLENDVTKDGTNSTADRYFLGTLSNMYIKMTRDPNIQRHTVLFSADGASVSPYSSRQVVHGTALGEVPVATKNHYDFVGWFTEANGGVQINENTIIDDDITYFAHFTPSVYTISFSDDNVIVSTLQKGFNEALGTLPTRSKAHYTFNGWFTEASGGSQITEQTVATGTVTYYAQYTPDPHTITFYDEDEVTVLSTSTIGYNEPLGTLPSPTKTNYYLVGWFTDTTYTTQVTSNTLVTGNASYYAKWEIQTGPLVYTISFNSHGGSSVNDMIIPQGDSIGTLPAAPVRTDYTFLGWYEEDTYVTPVTTSTIPQGNVTYHAKWIADSAYVARIGNTYFETLPDAFSSINNNTQTTIYVLQDITLSSGISIASGRNIILDIQNHTITGASRTLFENNGTFEISNGTVSLTGSGEKIAIINKTSSSRLTISSGTISSSFYQTISNNGILTITGGLITTSATQGAINNNESGTLYISGGTVSNTSTKQAIYNKGNLYISGSAHLISSASQRATVQNDHVNSRIEMSGGLVESTNASCERGAIQNLNGTLIITGGTVISNSNYSGSATGSGPGAIQNSGTLEIGSQNDLYDTTSPVLQGKKYGVNSTTDYAIYDGIIKGATAAVNDASKITSIETDMQDVSSTEVIDGTTYYTLYYEFVAGNRITFNPVGGTVSPTTRVVASGSSMDTLPTPTKTDYVFDDWYEEDTYVHVVTTSTVPTQDDTYYAKWTPSVTLASIPNDNITMLMNSTSTIVVSNSSSIEAFSYSSQNTSIATVDSSGVITAVSPGVTHIVLTGLRSHNEKHVTVTVNIANDITTFDIMPTAMRTYFDNIDSWASGQTDSNHSSYDQYMSNNLSQNDCINFDGDNRANKSNATGSVYCDQPNQYDTGVSGNVLVYEYDVSNQSIGSEATYVTVNNGKLYNMIPGKTYYWVSSNDSSVNGKVYAHGERRIITIDNLKSGSNDTFYQTRNVRDLGGIKVDTDGDGYVDGTIKYGKLYRGEKIWGGSGSSVQYFTKLGITAEMDLRADSEPVSGEEDVLSNRIIKSGSNNTFEIIHYGIDYSNEYMSNYLVARAAVDRIMDEFISGGNNYSLYFHCRIGADRTGTIAYLLEGLLGATEEERYRDFEMSVFFGLDERTRFYTNKTTNYVKFVHMKSAMRDASLNNTEDVVEWFLKGSSDRNSDLAKINTFRGMMIDPIS